MNILTLISAVLVSAIIPVACPDLPGVKETRAVVIDDVAVVAVLPDVHAGLEEKTETLSNAASSIGKQLDKEVVLTEDLLTYLTLSRIVKRGADDYERRNLAARLSRINAYCYTADKVG